MAGRGLLRELYARAAQSSLLGRPLARVRTHPRVRAFARRRVGILLARGTTWSNVDGALRLLAEDPAQPIVFGPWHGEMTAELLYWAPFVRWAQRHFGLDPSRVAVVSGAAAEQWYDGSCGHFFESLDDAAAALPGAAVFRPEPVLALVEEYRSGAAPLRPLLKRARHVRLPASADAGDDEGGLAADYGGPAILAALAGRPVIARTEPGANIVDPDVDLALRVVSGLGGSLVVLDVNDLSELASALGGTARPPKRAVQ